MAEIRLCQMALLHRVTKFELYFRDLNITHDVGHARHVRIKVQTTLSASLTFSDIGLHSGAPVTMRIHPAAADHGIWIKRTDITIGDPLTRRVGIM